MNNVPAMIKWNLVLKHIIIKMLYLNKIPFIMWVWVCVTMNTVNAECKHSSILIYMYESIQWCSIMMGMMKGFLHSLLFELTKIILHMKIKHQLPLLDLSKRTEWNHTWLFCMRNATTNAMMMMTMSRGWKVMKIFH